jgi:mono/diheme cytochrome c family protein
MLRFAGLLSAVLGAALATTAPAVAWTATAQRGAKADTSRVAAGGSADGASVTPAMVDAGRGIFHGQGGCFACHGTALQGSAVAPPLDKKGKPWIAATGGTYQAIFTVVTHGVPGTLMIAHPNGISDALAAKVAAYVWAVNHSGAKP